MSNETKRNDPWRERALLLTRRRFLGLTDVALPDPGRRNDSSTYRARLIARELSSGGYMESPEHQRDVRDLLASKPDASSFLARFPEVLGPELAEQVKAKVEACFTPTAQQAEEVARALDSDLRRFEDDWGIDAWAGRMPALATIGAA